MSTIVNDRDARLQATVPRLGSGGSGVVILCASPIIAESVQGVRTPALVSFEAVQLSSGTLTWDVDGGTLTGSGNTRSLDSSTITKDTITVTVTLTPVGGQARSFSTTVNRVRDGATAKNLTLTPVSQIFRIAKDGSNLPASILLSGVAQNLAGSPSFTIPSGTATLTAGPDAWTKTLMFADMLSDTVTIQLAQDGLIAKTTIVKIREGADGVPGADAITPILSNDTQVLPAEADGTVSSYAGAASTMSVYKGLIDDSASWSFSTSPASSSNLTYTFSNRTVTVTAMASNVDTAYVDIIATKSGNPTLTKRFTVSKVKVGASVSGPRGAGHYYTTGSAWSNTAAANACPGGPIAGDVVTISNGSTFVDERIYNGTNWISQSVVVDGSVIVQGSITASKINSNGLAIRDTQGNLILGAGSFLDDDYVPPSAQNSQLLPVIGEARATPYTSARNWDFVGASLSFTTSGITATQTATHMNIKATTATPLLTSPAITSLSGTTYDKIRMRVRRRVGTGWAGIVQYSTGGHSYSTSYQKVVTPDPTVLNQWVVVEWDMGALTAGGTEWSVNNITGLRFQLGNAINDEFDIDWITLGRYGPAATDGEVAAAATTANWSGVSGTGKPADNASSDITLVGRNVSVVGNVITKVAGAVDTWDADAYSSYGYTGGAFAEAVVVTTNQHLMFGLNIDPVTDSSFASIDYAMYLINDGTLGVYESSSNKGVLSTYVAGDVLSVTYDGSNVRYLKNGTAFRTVPAAITAPLFFDSSFHGMGGSLKNVRFGPLSSNNWASVGNRPDDQIRNNMLDLSWWNRGGTLGVANTSGETTSLLMTGSDTGVTGIKGPRGVDDVVVYSKELTLELINGVYETGAGGGWDGYFLNLDPTKTYRFVIPIRKISGSGSAYWGTQNVCNLNTTTASSNPYFASASGLLTDRWYLFVGYIYPAGSTGHTHDGAGIWDCKTGKKVAGGTAQNWTFKAGDGSVNHRAYQYYSSSNAEQAFGRPMINLVDGTEPALREFFEGPTLGVNVDGQINSGNVAGLVNIPNLSTFTAVIGTLRTATSGGRTEIKDNIIKVYDETNANRIKIGNLTL